MIAGGHFRGKQVHLRRNDVLLRSLGNVVYVMPPYCTSLDELDSTYETILQSLDLVQS